MNTLISFAIIAISVLQAANTTDSRLDYQKHLSRMTPAGEKPNLQALLKAAREEKNGISRQDYKFLKGTSAFAASGAEWVHKAGILGSGVTVLLLEDSGINHADIKGFVEEGSLEGAVDGFKHKVDHGSAMASLIHAIAPASTIRVRPIQQVFSSLKNVRIINASFSDEEVEGFQKTFEGITTDSNILITKSAGNNRENLSIHPHTQGCSTLLPFTIFVGNLRQDYKGRTSSGFPGDNPQFQESFLWAVADDVLTASGPDGSTQYSPGTGTSNAAAILSGAAALILSKYPMLPAIHIKEILLESADRDIFQEFGSGHRALHVTEGQPSSPQAISYNPAFWGKGILNIKNALLYADLKVANPAMSAHELRETMLQNVHVEQQRQAEKIQRKFRKRTNRPAPEELAKRAALTINTSLPDRVFSEAPGELSSQPIAEQSDAERLGMLGVNLPEPSRKLKVTSNTLSAAPKVATPGEFQPCEVPEGASQLLTRFLQATTKNDLCNDFRRFYQTELTRALNDRWASAATVVEKLINGRENLLIPFTVNQVIAFDGPKQVHIKPQRTVTLVELFHDAMRLYGQDNRIQSIAMELFRKIQEKGSMNNNIKSEILSLLKDYRTIDYRYGDKEFLTFIVDNDLLGVSFNHLQQPYGKKDQIETIQQSGADFFNTEQIRDFLRDGPILLRVKLTSFLHTLRGAKLCAEVAARMCSDEYFSKRYYGYFSNQPIGTLFTNLEEEAPNFVHFLQSHVNDVTKEAILAELKEKTISTFFSDYPERKESLATGFVNACRIIIDNAG